MKKNHVLLILAVTLLVLAATSCSRRAQKSYNLKRADELFDSGQFDTAETEYLNAIHANPRDARAIGRLGLIYFDEGRFQRAAPYLLRGSELSSSNMELRVKLGTVYLMVGDRKKAREQAEIVLKNSPGNPDAPILLAQSSSGAEISDAHRQLGASAASADSPAVETALGVLAAHQGDFKTALTDFQRALRLDQQFAPAYDALGNTYLQEKQVKKAGDAFKAASDCASSYSLLQTEFGNFEIQTADFPGAETFFNKLAQKSPDYMPVWLGLAEVNLDEKKLDDCATDLKKVLSRDEQNVDGLILTARLDMARTNTTQAISELEHLVKLYAPSPKIHYQLALAYIMGGKSDKAINQLHESLDLEPDYIQASFLLAELDVKKGDIESALGLLKPIVAREPDLVQAQLMLADVYRLQNDFTDAMAIYRQLEKSFPQSVEIPLLAGSACVQQFNEDAARSEFNRALQIDPNNITAQEELAQIDLADKNYDAAQQRVQKMLTKFPQKQSQLEILLAKILMDRGQTSQAEDALVTAAGLPGGSEANLILAQLYFKLKEDKDALDRVNVALTQQPSNGSLLMLKADIQTDQQDYNGAASTYEQILNIDPKFSPALNNLAWLYSDHLGDLDKAYALAQRARQLLPNDPSTADTLGWILFKRGDYTSALNLFQQSAGGLPNNPEVLFHFGLAYYMLDNEDAARGELQGAMALNSSFPDRAGCQKYLDILNYNPASANSAVRSVLETRIAQQPNDPVAFNRLVAIYQRDGDTARATSLCQSALNANPKNVKALMLLAQVTAAQDPQKALALAKSAYQLSPNDPNVCAVLGHLAYVAGNDQWAFSLLDEASQDQTTNGQTLFDLAHAAFCLGKISDAQSDMQNAVQNGLSASQATQAKNFLDMVTLCESPDEAAANQTRVESVLASEPENPPALYVEGLIKTQNNDTVAAEHAYEELLAHHPDCTIANKNLAMLYAQTLADPAKAYPVALKAREAFPDDPQVARALAMVLFQQGNYTRAADLFNTISNSAGADARVFYCLGICEYHLKNYLESKSSLERALNMNLSGQEASDARQTLAELH